MRLGETVLGLMVAGTLCAGGCDRDDAGRGAAASGSTVAPPASTPAAGAPASVAPVAERREPDFVESGSAVTDAVSVGPAGREPAATGATPPATEPAAASSRETSPTPFQPLADAKAGEWAVYAALGSRTLRYQVREVGLSRVKTEVTAELDKRPLGMPAIREDLRTADPLAWETPAGGQRQTSRTALRAAGRDWEAILYEDRWVDEGVHYVRRTWVAKDAPVFGIVRMELTGDGTLEARMELVEMGNGDRRNDPPGRPLP